MKNRITLGKLIKLGKVHSQTGPFGTQLRASDYVDDGIPVINVRNIGFGDIRRNSLEYVDADMAVTLKNHKLKKNDIVFGRKGAVERHALISSNEEGWIQGSDCIRLRFLTNEFDPFFISFFFRTEEHKQWMINLGSFGATMGTLNQDIISKIEIPNIPLPIQQKIASILSAYDDLIEINKRRIQLLEEMAEEIYKEWFVRMRFPGYENTRFFNEAGEEVPHGTDGALPEGWEKVKLGEKFKISLGGTPSRNKESYWNGEIPWINSGKVNDIRIIDPSELISDLGLKNSATKILPKRTTVLAITGATLGQVSMLEIDTCTNQSVVGIKDPQNKIDEFVYLAIKNKIHELVNFAGGGAQQHINKNIVEETIFILPDFEVVNAFNALVKPQFDLLANLLFKNLLLQQTRDLLLPRLISGKLSVEHLLDNEENQLLAAEPEVQYQNP